MPKEPCILDVNVIHIPAQQKILTYYDALNVSLAFVVDRITGGMSEPDILRKLYFIVKQYEVTFSCVSENSINSNDSRGKLPNSSSQ